MNFHLILFFSLLVLFSCNSPEEETEKSPANDQGNPKIAFDKTEHDFGRVKQGEKVGWFFTYKNVGDSDLIIKRASASCGCTVPEYNKKPLPPGEEASLKVIYDSSGRLGMEVKTITLQSNAENALVKLKLKVEVIN